MVILEVRVKVIGHGVLLDQSIFGPEIVQQLRFGGNDADAHSDPWV